MATAKKTAKKKAAPKSKAPVKKSAPPKKKAPPAKKKEAVSVSKPAAGTKKSSASKSSLNPLGKKFTCHTCGTKFYDLNKEVKICPKCGADQSKRPPSKSRSRVAAARVEEEEFPEENLDYDSEAGFEEEEGIVEEPLEEEEDEEEEEE
ncbi:FYDLN acid domain-containing protein [Leptospira venezuelensis]|uniref:FYDLN acid domain-containing protein n=1 Tax=Leptospira venezuelensis TaxID=1958811 RepID=UPI000A3C3A8A|nr:FYDLN acid domain-containing protein [Leptospira venezuelensis]